MTNQFHRRMFFAAASLVVAVFLAGCTGPLNTVLEQLTEARRLSADLLVQFAKSVDATNRAVMADTDESSAVFGKEATEAMHAVETDAAALGPLLTTMGCTQEAALLQEFVKRFAEYQDLDQQILALAVERTNLKAQRLSFGPAQQAADAFRDALNSLSPAGPEGSLRLDALVATAIASLREIQVLQAPHIAEPDDAAMTRIEERMHAADGSVRKSMAAIKGMIQPGSRGKLEAATTALDQFTTLNTEILTLSRRNSNVKSVALSLGQKRTLTAACEETLRAIQDALAKRDFRATR